MAIGNKDIEIGRKISECYTCKKEILQGAIFLNEDGNYTHPFCSDKCIDKYLKPKPKKKKHPYSVIFNGYERVLSKEDYETMEEHLHHL